MQYTRRWHPPWQACKRIMTGIGIEGSSVGDRRPPPADRRRNCDRSRRPADRRAKRGIRVFPFLLLPVRVLHLRLLPVLLFPRPVLGLGRVGLAGLPDVRTIRVPRRRGRDPPPTVCERRDHEGSVRPDDAGHHAKPKPASIDEATTTRRLTQ